MKNKTSKNEDSTINNSVYSALEIINYLTGKDWCRIKDIAEAIDMNVSKVHRLLNTMMKLDFVQYDSITRRYQLGLKFFTIAYHMSQSSLISTAKIHMERAAKELFSTINLGIINNSKTEITCIFRLEGNLSPGLSDVPIGVNKTVNASAIGKCILAHLPYLEQQSILQKINYIKYTDSTITTAEGLSNELSKIKEQGYSVDDFEYNENLFCIAMPIFLNTGQVFAAVSVSLHERPQKEHMTYVLAVLEETASKISQELGYQPAM
ncbi:MAG: IclR family transcriptional regulator [Anaerolineaceae bacterium]|nr:MAG: IclR family transcriptional regulator [Anaerolineaceae bacterium]